MKKLFVIAAAAVCAIAAFAGEPAGGVFRHFGIGVGAGTTGIQIEAAAPITHWVTMRAGVAIMPGITFNSDADVTYSNSASDHAESNIDLQGDLGRTQGLVIFNFYPIPKQSLYIAAGAYFGGSELIKVTGHSTELEGRGGDIVIGDYKIPVNDKGEARGGIKVNSFRPYLGLGWGRAVPGKRVNFNIELGVQIHGKPGLYTDYGEVTVSDFTDDNTFNKIMDKVKVYPNLTFRLGFRII